VAFPLIGLLHNVPMSEVPVALRIRLCINLADSNWPGQIRAGLEGRPPTNVATVPPTAYVWTVHHNFNGDRQLLAVEVHSRFGELFAWRFVMPNGFSPEEILIGPAGRDAVASTGGLRVDGYADNDPRVGTCHSLGAAERLSASVSAYLVIRGNLPAFLGFGETSQAWGPTINIEFYRR
jgi:hypothetical protein